MTSKAEILAANAVRTGTAKIGSAEISIRGLTAGETIKWGGALRDNSIEILAACITEPTFTAKELSGLQAGALTDAFLAIVEISGADEKAEEKNS